MSSNYNAASSRHSSSSSSNFSSESDFVSARSTPATSVSPHRHYIEDLPPTYEQVQAENLDPVGNEEHHLSINDHAGVNDLRVHRLVLDDNETYTLPSAEDDPGPNAPAYSVSDPDGQLLDQALQFARHQPDPDARYAARLGRRIVIPPLEISPFYGRNTNGGRNPTTQKRGCCGRNKRQTPSQSDSTSSSRGGCCQRRQASMPSTSCHSRTSLPFTLSPEEPELSNQTTIPFARAYSKALHAHGISSTKFVAFLDGLNIVSSASPADLSSPEPSDSQPLALAYLSRANAAFFAPRGLQVRLATLSAIIDGLDVPSKFSRTTLLARAASPTADAIDRAQMLEPWVEPLDFSVPEPSAATIELRQMAAQLPVSNRRVQRAESAPTIIHFTPPATGPNGFPLDNKQPFPSIQPASAPPRRQSTERPFPGPSNPSSPPPQHPETWQEWSQRWQTRALALGLQAEAWSRDVSAQADALGRTIALRAETYGRGVQYGPGGLWGAGQEMKVKSGERKESSASGWCGRKGSAASLAGPARGCGGQLSRESISAAALSRPSMDGSVSSSSSSSSSMSRTQTTSSSTNASTSVPDIASINSRFEEQVKAITAKAEAELTDNKTHYAEISRSKQRALEKAAQEKTKAEVKLEALRLKAEIEIAKKEAKKAAKAEKKALKGSKCAERCAEKKRAREERREAKREAKEVRRAAKVGVGEERNMVWLVVENLKIEEKAGGAVGTVVYEGT
ncbi:hypothetical protein H2201_001524 [Coniosporium apollinis]|uniref:Uncharacterized protein n=1 Tax=Coniosporium apollinis TaxID=61459 RepID=A0ABQ9P1J5_9PEZI|nr:hypothetical protein H2201_001524 [Coniosporium apollinis]